MRDSPAAPPGWSDDFWRLLGGQEQAFAFIQRALEAHPDGVYWMDAHDNFVYLNGVACSALGYAREELVGKNLLFINRMATPERMAQVWNVLRSEGTYQVETTLHRKDGTDFPIEILASYVKLGDREYNCGYARNITTRIQVREALTAAKEAAEATSRLKSEFLNIAAHELKTPLAAVVLSVQLASNLLEAGAPPRQALERARGRLSHLTELVNDLVDVARLERQRLSLRRSRTDLGALVNQVVEDFAILAPGRVVFDAGARPVIFVEADTVRIQQVLYNLLDNAMKHGVPQGSVQVRVRPSERQVRVEVVDGGPGIPKPLQAGLFTQVFQTTGVRSGSNHGLGLGLFICQGILALHEGSIGVDSDSGRGSTFFFELPTVE
ncbi:MAG: PAS domain S-box protein [Deltaproteobacteria bacterium]|nr:PAS domain S-box protein [Deltaproteobacteria bacterium]